MVANMSVNRGNNKRTFCDKFISNFNSLWFAFIEPIKIKYARLRFKKNYLKKNKNPLVSICIPTFNRGPILIDRAVKSALSQSYKNIELIIVGDHCTDNTPELLAKIKDPRLKFYNLPKRIRSYRQNIENHWLVGGAEPANKAMDLANGEWFARLDDDDTWSTDHIEKLLKLAIDGDYEFVSGLYEEERFGKRVVVDGVNALDSYYTRDSKTNTHKSPKIGGVSTWLYRSYLKGMKYNLNCWRKEWNKVWDIDLALRIYHAEVRMGFLEEVVAYVLPRPGEESIGLDAYKLTRKEKLKQYKFK
jgi:glycosyltransferase involved in cell wall biosynthesis